MSLTRNYLTLAGFTFVFATSVANAAKSDPSGFCLPVLSRMLAASPVEAQLWSKFQAAEVLLFSKATNVNQTEAVEKAFNAAKHDVFKAVSDLDDASLRVLLESFIDHHMKKKKYLPGGLPHRAGEERKFPYSMADLIRDFVSTDLAENYGLKNIAGNLVSPIYKDYFDAAVAAWVEVPNRHSSAEVLKELPSLEHSVIDYSAVEVFRRRLRDGKWTLIDNAEDARRYREMFSGESGEQTRRKIRESNQWRDIEF